MKKKLFDRLSRRERQLIDIIYRLGEATVAEVREALPDPPSYSSVRAIMNILKDKGFVRYERRGRTYIYRPTVSPEKARRSALGHILKTFFNGSIENAVAALIDLSAAELTEEQLGNLEGLIREKLNKERAN
jgi:predicted transcriptional regulator